MHERRLCGMAVLIDLRMLCYNSPFFMCNSMCNEGIVSMINDIPAGSKLVVTNGSFFGFWEVSIQNCLVNLCA